MSMSKQLSRRRAPRSPISEPPSPERNHRCDFEDGACGKAFARKSDLQRHLRIHNNERPFKCLYKACGKSFIQRSALVVHERTHTGEKPHKCETCRKAFADSSSLARHRRIHTGNKPYQCHAPGCGNQYCRKVTLTRHYKSIHPELNMPSTYQVPGLHAPAQLCRPRRSTLSRKRKADYTSSSSEEDDDEKESIIVKYEYESEDQDRPGSRVAKRAAGTRRGDGGKAKAKRQRHRSVPEGADHAAAYSPSSLRTRRGGMNPKVMPWQEEDADVFQPAHLPVGLGAPIKLQALYDHDVEMDDGNGEYTPEPELIDICNLPGFCPPLTMEPLDLERRRYTNQGRLLDNSPLLVHPQPLPLHVQVNTASWADNTATFTPQSVDGETFDTNYEEPCHLAFTPHPGAISTPMPIDYETETSSASLWGPQIHYPMVPHYSPVSSSSSTLADGSIYSCTSAATIAPLALSPSAHFSQYERKVSDSSLSVYSIPDGTYSPYTEKFDGYYTPVTPGSTYWHVSRLQQSQVVYLQPYTPLYSAPTQRVPSQSSVIGLGIANVSLGSESPYAPGSARHTSELYQAAPTPAPVFEHDHHRPVTEEEYDQLSDEPPTFIEQELLDSDDEHVDRIHDDDEMDSDYVDARPKSRKRRSKK